MTKEEKMLKLVEYAKIKFKKYKLIGWHLYFTNHCGVLGMCYYDRKRIRMSIPWLTQLGMHENKQVFLHEIAHALTSNKERAHGHVWEKNCKRVGCRDTMRDFKYSGTKKLPPKYMKNKKIKYYEGTCPACDWSALRSRRMSGNCPACVKLHNEGYEIIWTEL